MTINEITNKDLLEYLKLDEEEDLSLYLLSAIDFVINYTGLTIEELNQKPSVIPAIYVLVADYYENRAFTVSNDKVNALVTSTLEMYRKNLI